MKGQRALTRGMFRTLDPLAPGLAARLGANLWCTPPRLRHRPSGAPDLPPGTRLTVAVPGFASPVVAESWGSGPIVYLLHGWGGWRGQLAALVAPLLAAGYRVVAIDGPGHGETGPGRLGGRRTTPVEFSEALAAVVAVIGPAHAVVAHSAGATATGFRSEERRVGEGRSPRRRPEQEHRNDHMEAPEYAARADTDGA